MRWMECDNQAIRCSSRDSLSPSDVFFYRSPELARSDRIKMSGPSKPATSAMEPQSKYLSESTHYLSSMCDSSEDEDGIVKGDCSQTRDEGIKKFREGKREWGSRYNLRRSLAWSQDDELDEDDEDRMEADSSDPLTDLSLSAMLENICTISPREPQPLEDHVGAHNFEDDV